MRNISSSSNSNSSNVGNINSSNNNCSNINSSSSSSSIRGNMNLDSDPWQTNESNGALSVPSSQRLREILLRSLCSDAFANVVAGSWTEGEERGAPATSMPVARCPWTKSDSELLELESLSGNAPCLKFATCHNNNGTSNNNNNNNNVQQSMAIVAGTVACPRKMRPQQPEGCFLALPLPPPVARAQINFIILVGWSFSFDA
ncbi:hypothetical protein AWZ03_008397 [Drosophila navojoa]|uniref:Uncharacterized protein n=1 Tax=Drosophila navojoa TaxID=7232 RepID=A0A484B8E5_DRONA|nr:hypothetical protein AWZ03_008397 [Drosophila navojoa]